MRLHKYVFVVLIFAMVFTLTACGKTTPETSSSDYQGEDQVQNEIKSDEEIIALQEEESADTTDAQPTTEDGTENNQPGNNNSAPGYVSADNFWNGNNFDLEGYLYANGAKWVKKGYDHAAGTGFNESDTDVMFYMAYFNDTYWMITIGQGSVVFEYRGYQVNGDTVYGPYYVAGQRTTDYLNITTNGYNTYCTDALISILDDMLYMTICHPDSDNPFQYSENNGSLYILEVTNTDIPAGATHR